jgi:glycogen(starch) synthase
MLERLRETAASAFSKELNRQELSGIGMKRILFWSGTFWPNIGGVEVIAARLLPALRDHGYEHAVIAPKSHAGLSDEAQYNGIPIYRFPFRNNPRATIDHVIAMKKKIAALKQRFAPDLIHINAVGVDNFFHLATANVYHAPVLVTLHGKWPNRANAIVAEVLCRADWVVGCSDAMLQDGRTLTPQITARSSVIYNAVEAPSVLPAPLPFNPPQCLCIGRLASDKGFDLAVSAFRLVSKQVPHARLVIVGDGPERTALERQATDQGVTHSVEFRGWVAPKSVAGLINSSTIVLMPSREESFGLVALEAAFMARPVVASRVGGLPEIVIHGTNGLLIDKGDIQTLANAIVFLLTHRDTATKMGRSARIRVQTVFSWKNHVDSYAVLYRKIIDRSRPLPSKSPPRAL